MNWKFDFSPETSDIFAVVGCDVAAMDVRCAQLVWSLSASKSKSEMLGVRSKREKPQFGRPEARFRTRLQMQLQPLTPPCDPPRHLDTLEVLSFNPVLPNSCCHDVISDRIVAQEHQSSPGTWAILVVSSPTFRQ